ncbi:MAG: hypothetical protein JST86_13105 [Bacteroidetes bacterium]|nr:hypothetical protein [Bacteroidota bacterium]
MTRLIFFFSTLFFSTTSYGQSKVCLADTSSISGQILTRLSSEGIAGISVTNKRTGKKYQGYRLCEHHYLQIDSLNQSLSNSQIDTLLKCDNGTLKTVAFILFAKRHNNKYSVVKKLTELLNQEYVVMTRSCSDAIQMTSLGQFNYDLLTKSNFFFNPKFKLTRKDIATIQLDLAYYELPMKSSL